MTDPDIKFKSISIPKDINKKYKDLFNFIAPFGGCVCGGFALHILKKVLIQSGEMLLPKEDTECNDVDIYFKYKEGYNAFSKLADKYIKETAANGVKLKPLNPHIYIPQQQYSLDILLKKNNYIFNNNNSPEINNPVCYTLKTQSDKSYYEKETQQRIKELQTIYKNSGDMNNNIKILNNLKESLSFYFRKFNNKLSKDDIHKICLTEDIFDKYLFLSSLYNRNVQFIIPKTICGNKAYGEDITDIIQHFDLNICCVGIDIEKNLIIYDSTIPHHLSSKRFTVNNYHQNAMVTFIRMSKYLNKGYSCSMLEKYKLLAYFADYVNKNKDLIDIINDPIDPNTNDIFDNTELYDRQTEAYKELNCEELGMMRYLFEDNTPEIIL